MVKTLLLNIVFGCLSVLVSTSFAQEIERFELPEALEEISGLKRIAKNRLVALNDGGNKPNLYVLDFKGKLIKKVKVTDAENKDWEDLAIDDKYLYIGDFGNNENKRKKLIIYRVKIKDVLEKKEVESKKIKFSYEDQTKFPPSKKNFNFDAEGFVCDGDSLMIFTKNNTKPWNGKSSVYRISKSPGTHIARKSNELYIGPDGWWMDAITAADKFNEYIYLSTYNRVIIFKYAEYKFNELKEVMFEDVSQKESIVVLDKNYIFVADEKHRILGGGYLIKYKLSYD